MTQVKQTTDRTAIAVFQQVANEGVFYHARACIKANVIQLLHKNFSKSHPMTTILLQELQIVKFNDGNEIQKELERANTEAHAAVQNDHCMSRLQLQLPNRPTATNLDFFTALFLAVILYTWKTKFCTHFRSFSRGTRCKKFRCKCLLFFDFLRTFGELKLFPSPVVSNVVSLYHGVADCDVSNNRIKMLSVMNQIISFSESHQVSYEFLARHTKTNVGVMLEVVRSPGRSYDWSRNCFAPVAHLTRFPQAKEWVVGGKTTLVELGRRVLSGDAFTGSSADRNVKVTLITLIPISSADLVAAVVQTQIQFVQPEFSFFCEMCRDSGRYDLFYYIFWKHLRHQVQVVGLNVDFMEKIRDLYENNNMLAREVRANMAVLTDFAADNHASHSNEFIFEAPLSFPVGTPMIHNQPDKVEVLCVEKSKNTAWIRQNLTKHMLERFHKLVLVIFKFPRLVRLELDEWIHLAAAVIQIETIQSAVFSVDARWYPDLEEQQILIEGIVDTICASVFERKELFICSFQTNLHLVAMSARYFERSPSNVVVFFHPPNSTLFSP